MDLIIRLSPSEQSRLEEAAQQEGVAPEELAHKLVTEHLPPTSIGQSPETDPTPALFAQWAEEDDKMTSEEIEQEAQSWEEFKHNINEERRRAGARIIYP